MAPQKESKFQRLKQWLCAWLCSPEVAEENPSKVVKLPGSRERFTFDGYDIEADIKLDKVVLSVYLKGKRILKGWVYHRSDGQCVTDHSISFEPNYKLRRVLKEYAERRLREQADINSKDLD